MRFNGSPTKGESTASFPYEWHFVAFVCIYNMHQDKKSARLIAVCKRSFTLRPRSFLCLDWPELIFQFKVRSWLCFYLYFAKIVTIFQIIRSWVWLTKILNVQQCSRQKIGAFSTFVRRKMGIRILIANFVKKNLSTHLMDINGWDLQVIPRCFHCPLYTRTRTKRNLRYYDSF